MSNVESLLSIDELLAGVRSSFLVGGNNKKDVFGFSSVVTDSRNVAEGSLFVPLVGQSQDGHKYVESAVEKGASVIFINKTEYDRNKSKYDLISEKNKNLCLVAVPDTLRALQEAAAAYVEKFPSLIKVGITGSSGKTTTKEMVVSVLKQKYNVVYTQGNFNSETGLPLSVFNIRSEHSVGVFEMGMNRVDEIGEIAAVLKPKYALVTNVGTAHIGILGSQENIAAEKRKIFNYIPEDGVAFIPAEDDFKEFLGQNVKGKITYYGKSVPDSESGAQFVKDCGLEGTIFKLDGEVIYLKNPGIYNYRNALGACAIGKQLGLSACQIKAGLEKFDPVDGRMETKSIKLKTGVNITLIKDCYNANPDSMMNVLDFCSSLEGINEKILVLGDMLELGDKSVQEHEKVVQKAVKAKPGLLILIGEEMKHGYEAAVRVGFLNSKYIPGHDEEAMNEAAESILKFAKEKDMVLLKASHGIALERIIPIISAGDE